MIPLRDRNPSGTVPYVTIALIVLNAAVYLHETALPRNRLEPFIEQYGVRPALVVEYLRGDPKLKGHFVPIFLPFLTSMFLHGGLLHILGNMLYLWIFGDNVEDRMGHAKFLGFYLVCGVIGGVGHVVFNPDSLMPTVGASGAIAGVLGAYMLAFPHAKVATLVFLGFIITVVNLPAILLLGYWFLIQFLSGLGSVRMAGAGGVAWWAHIGGFVVGMLLLPILQKPPSQRRLYVSYR